LVIGYWLLVIGQKKEPAIMIVRLTTWIPQAPKASNRFDLSSWVWLSDALGDSSVSRPAHAPQPPCLSSGSELEWGKGRAEDEVKAHYRCLSVERNGRNGAEKTEERPPTINATLRSDEILHSYATLAIPQMDKQPVAII
jgi:hypothetical protein